jgi:hypothetical protein
MEHRTARKQGAAERLAQRGLVLEAIEAERERRVGEYRRVY